MHLGGLGAQLLLVGRDEQALAAVVQEVARLGVPAEAIPCDLATDGAIRALAATMDAAGGCDILVNAAGIGKIGKPIDAMPVEDFDAVLATNLRAPFLLMQLVIPSMKKRGGGHIVNISSLAGQGPLPNGAAYAASKWALNGLTYAAAEELRADNIRVSVVAPGSVNTSFGVGNKDRSKMLQPEDVASVVALLVTQPPQSFISEVRMRPTQKP